MHYEEFRFAWEEALREARILSFHHRTEETIDVATMSRRYLVQVGSYGGEPAVPAPFTASLEMKWKWDALQSARSEANEEDLLLQLFGSRKRERMATGRPWLRVDVEFSAAPPLDQPLRMPGTEDWRAWVDETKLTVDPLLPIPPKLSPQGFLLVDGWLGEPEAEVSIVERPTPADQGGVAWVAGDPPAAEVERSRPQVRPAGPEAAGCLRETAAGIARCLGAQPETPVGPSRERRRGEEASLSPALMGLPSMY